MKTDWIIESHGLRGIAYVTRVCGTRITVEMKTTSWLPRTLTESTLHIGGMAITKKISNHVTVGYGDSVTLVQELELSGLL